MQAVQVTEFGDPSVLRLTELAAPHAGPGEVLVDVDAAGVNFGDLLVREGAYFGRQALPVLPGWEVVGRVADPGDSAYRAGERVAAMLDAGGYAQQVIAPIRDTVAVPDGVPDHVALAFVIQGATAWHVLERPFAVGAGDRVLISGAGSGVTHLCVQLALRRGASRVSVVSSSPQKGAIIEALGGEAVLVGDGDDAVAALADRLGPGSVDHVVDMVGGPVLDGMLRCLRAGGRAVVYGVAGGTPTKIGTGALLRFGLTISGLWLGRDANESLAATLERLFALYEGGLLYPTLGPVLPLADAGRAHELVASRRAVGKVMLTVR